jgi:twitching motility protein PilJ
LEQFVEIGTVLENHGDGMDREPRVQGAGNRKIHGKLLWSFTALIALTLAVVAITLISQTLAQKTLTEVVQVHGRLARLSLEAEKTLRVMQSLEKDFLLNKEKLGIREAKETYLTPFVAAGGEIHRTLYQIQQLAKTQQDKDATQMAMDAIDEYLNAFVGTVSILELRLDKESGELVKLRQSIDNLGASTAAHPAVMGSLYQLKSALQEYLMVPERNKLAAVKTQRAGFAALIEQLPVAGEKRARIVELLAEFDKWLAQVINTDGTIAARISGYQDAVKRAEPVIRSFLDYAVASEATATKNMEDTSALFKKIVLAVGFFAIILAIVLATKLSRVITNQVNHIMTLQDEIRLGNYQARTPVVGNDELGAMATGLNAMLDDITALIQSQDERVAIQKSIMKLLEDISTLTDGDFTSRAEVTEDMTGAIADSFNAMADQFSDIISRVKIATQSVDRTSEEVANQTIALAAKNIEQVKGVTAAVAAIERMVESIRAVADNAQKSASVSRQSRRNAQDGALAVIETNKAMEEIRQQINETARSIKRLGETSLEIGNIVHIIDEIADRTSILALNASIQAAMAGEAGHGFAVVADEVQRLADSSGNSTKQIELLVKSIQTEIKEVSNRIEEGIGKVVQGSKLADGAHEKLQEIEKVSNDLAELIESITVATTSQVQLSETIAKTMKEVGEVSRESSLSSQETAASMNILSKTARDLRSAVDVFKVGDAVAN